MADKKKTTTKNDAATDKTAKTQNTKTAKASSNTGASTGSTKEKSVSELVSVLSEKTGLPKNKAKEFLEAHAEFLVDELKNIGSVQLVGVGKLKLNERAERQGRNPSTGEAITIKASKQVKFAGGKKFKDSFNG